MKKQKGTQKRIHHFRTQSLGVTKLGRELLRDGQHRIKDRNGNECWNESIAMNMEGRLLMSGNQFEVEKKLPPYKRYARARYIASVYNLLI